MCGLVGVISYKENANENRDYIDYALSDMKMRGPDSSKSWTDNKTYICGFNRLSIRDLSIDADQPMASDCLNHILSFNGEIYNTDLVKSKLNGFQIPYRTKSDTEILLYSLKYLGIEKTLEIVDGMYAFAYYKVKEERLILARDRAGIKPLYMGKSKDGFVYSSQYNHVMNHKYIKKNSLNSDAIGQYLQFGFIPDGSPGIINNTMMIPHGYYIDLNSNGNFEMVNFWDYPLEIIDSNENFFSAVNRSVNSQLVSDVPIGTFMSGGVDSNIVSCLANKSKQINSFTIGFNDSQFDESEYAKAYASIFDTNHNEKFFSVQMLQSVIEDHVKAYSEPFADFSSLPTLLLSEYASSHVTVALSGDGGDELFFGYPRSISFLSKIDYINMGISSKYLELFQRKFFGKKSKITRKETLYSNCYDYYYHTLFISGAAHWVSRLIESKPSKAFFFNNDHHSLSKNTVKRSSLMQIIRKLEYDINLQKILLKVDRASMHNSLEVRVPLLGNEIIDFSTSINYDRCISNDKGKIPLRNTLKKYISSNSLINEKKMGFTIPIDRWIRTSLKDEIIEKIYDMPSGLAGIINHTQAKKLINEHLDKTHNWGWMIWSIYSLVRWYDYHRN